MVRVGFPHDVPTCNYRQMMSVRSIECRYCGYDFILVYVSDFQWWMRYLPPFCVVLFCTVSVETGMQNSGLGSELARDHFSTLAMTPCAISALFHCLIGSLAAAYWRLRPVVVEEEGNESSFVPKVKVIE